jgi:hypothetical protein
MRNRGRMLKFPRTVLIVGVACVLILSGVSLSKWQSAAQPRIDVALLTLSFVDTRMLPEQAHGHADTGAVRNVVEKQRLAAEAEATGVAAEQKKFALEAAALGPATEPMQSNDAIAVVAAATILQSPVQSTGAETARDCSAADVTAEALPAGQSQITVTSPCRKSEPIQLTDGAMTMTRSLDGNGRATAVIDVLMPQSTPIVVTFNDGQSRDVVALTGAPAGVTKVAVIWQGPVDLELHAFEYAALPAEPGHVWSGAKSSHEETLRRTRGDSRGHGFLTSSSEPGAAGGRMQVYSFVHTADAPKGIVTMRPDYASRGELPAGDFCGSGQFSTVAFDVLIRSGTGDIRQERGVIPSARCGEKLDPGARLIGGAVPDIRVRN